MVSQTPEGTSAGVVHLPVAATVAAAATSAGLPVAAVRATLTTDAYGSSAWRFALSTEGGGDVLVHLETVAFLAWPHAFAPRDARLRWSLDHRHAATLPSVPAGAQLVVVERWDDVTQVLVRSPGRVVASASADLEDLASLTDRPGAPGDPAGTWRVQALADLAQAVALTPGGGGS